MINYVVKKRLVFPVMYPTVVGKNSVVYQIDNVLMSAGFKLSHNLFLYLQSLDNQNAVAAGKTIVKSIKELVGDHVKHNTYFKKFPDGIPDTFEFWFSQIIKLFITGDCEYGRYQHSYEEMLAYHEQFKDKFGTNYRVIHLGNSLDEELFSLFTDLAGSTVPLNEDDRDLLAKLTKGKYINYNVVVPVRENKAIINSFLLKNGNPIIADTLTDILRVAAYLSDSDVTLQTSVKFKSFPRKYRRSLVGAMDSLLRKNPDKVDDMLPYREVWKRLGEKLHVNELPFEKARNAFAIVRKEYPYTTWAGLTQQHFLNKDYNKAIQLLGEKPGYLFRNIDRIARSCNEKDFTLLLNKMSATADKVSGRVLLSLREFLMNRENNEYRIFVNSKGKAHIKNNNLKHISNKRLVSLYEIIDSALVDKLKNKEFQLDLNLKNFSSISLPISEKNKSEGFDVLPRGSVITLDGNRRIVRFFVYWKEKSQRTDYDLSVVFYDKSFHPKSQVSWTGLRNNYAYHSGDITNGRGGASEFIDIDLDHSPDDIAYFVPTVNIFCGERFNETEECFFGYMERNLSEKGKPFEAKTVKTKFALRGNGKVCLPLAFYREDNRFNVKWMDLYVQGLQNYNRVEKNCISTGNLAKGIIERNYLSLQYLLDLYELAGSNISYTDQITSDVITLQTLSRLIP